MKRTFGLRILHCKSSGAAEWRLGGKKLNSGLRSTLRAGREPLQNPGAADDLFDRFELRREEIGEVLASFCRDHDDVFVANGERFVIHAELRVDGEDAAAGFEHRAGAFSCFGRENFSRANTGSIQRAVSLRICSTVTPSRMRPMIASRYSRI